MFTLILFIIIISLIFSIILIKYLSRRIEPAFSLYVEEETKRITTYIINKSVSEELKKYNINSLLNNKELNINTNDLNKILLNITNKTENNLKSIANLSKNNIINLDSITNMDYEIIGKKIVFEATLGSFIGGSLLVNIGPKVPVRIDIASDVISDINTKVKEYGINNALLEIYISINVNTVVNTPFVFKTDKITVNIPILIKVIEGNIPNYYIPNTIR